MQTWAAATAPAGRVVGLPAVPEAVPIDGCVPDGALDAAADRLVGAALGSGWVGTSEGGAALGAASLDTVLSLHEHISTWHALSDAVDARYALLTRTATFEAANTTAHEMTIWVFGWPFGFPLAANHTGVPYAGLQLQLVDLGTGDALWEGYVGDVCPLDPGDIEAAYEDAAEAIAKLAGGRR